MDQIRSLKMDNIDTPNNIAPEGVNSFKNVLGKLIEDVDSTQKTADAKRDWHLYNAGIQRFSKTKATWTMLEWGNIEHLDNIGSMADW